jgi:hypothetical protein
MIYGLARNRRYIKPTTIRPPELDLENLLNLVLNSCRLLRNRVSAQQARERKKAYLSELEVRVKDLEKRSSELEERLSTLQNENQMLRQVRAHVSQSPVLLGLANGSSLI